MPSFARFCISRKRPSYHPSFKEWDPLRKDAPCMQLQVPGLLQHMFQFRWALIRHPVRCIFWHFKQVGTFFKTDDIAGFLTGPHVIMCALPIVCNTCLPHSLNPLILLALCLFCFAIFRVVLLHVCLTDFFQDLIYVSGAPRAVAHGDMSTWCHSSWHILGKNKIVD